MWAERRGKLFCIEVHGAVRIPGLRRADVWSAVSATWESPAHSVAHIHDAITRAAHHSPTARAWASNEVEHMASSALYQRAHVLAAIPDEERAELGW